MKTLQFIEKVRKGGLGKSEVHYQDIMIDGQSLLDILEKGGEDLVAPFGKVYIPAYAEKVMRIFQLREVSDLDDKRVMFYVCPECGDIGCGAITGKIVEEGDKIIWFDFAYETGAGIEEQLEQVSPIEFERDAYFKALDSLR
ncbi:hypothetical protein HRH25_23810 [Flavisolibacter sp. BT320]|nr:hypothetical protein [Flavisolibacter longurius]